MADIRDSHAPATPQSPLVLPTELWLEMINYLRAKDIIALISVSASHIFHIPRFPHSNSLSQDLQSFPGVARPADRMDLNPPFGLPRR